VTAKQRWTLIAAILGSGIVFLDSTMVNVALPKIGRELPSNLFGVLEGQSYIYNGYLLTLSALLILAGALNDYYGRKRMFTLGLVGFLATTILGPFVGGILVDSISWRAAFLINVPLLVVAIWATASHVQESRDEGATGRFDWLGAFVVAVAVGGLSFGTIYGQQRDWRDPLGFVMLGLGTAATIALPFLMTRRRDPLIPPELFRSRNFTVTNISTFLIYGALYVLGYFVTLFVQGTIGFTAAAAGLAFIPSGLFLVFLSSRFGALAGKYGPKVFMAVGPALMCLGTLWYLRVPSTTSPWRFTFGDPSTYLPPPSWFVDFLPATLLFGLGLSIMVAPLTTALMTSVPPRNSGVASAINNAISRVGPQLAGAVIFIAITTSFYAGLHDRVPQLDPNDPGVRQTYAPLNVTPDSTAQAQREASTDAFHLAMLISALLCGAGAAVNALGIENRPAPQRAEAARAAA
jgi:MFS family permease